MSLRNLGSGLDRRPCGLRPEALGFFIASLDTAAAVGTIRALQASLNLSIKLIAPPALARAEQTFTYCEFLYILFNLSADRAEMIARPFPTPPQTYTKLSRRSRLAIDLCSSLCL
jgi:hypothetical protein